MYDSIIATYSWVDKEMVHDGYFVYGGGLKLGWISKNNIEGVYHG